MTMKARDSAPVGEARPSSDLVEGIARAIAIRLAKLDWGEAYEGFESSHWLKAQPLARAALSHISSLGMVVVPRSALTPWDDSHLVLELRDAASRIVDIDDYIVVHLAAEALEARGVHSIGEANPPRDERAVTDNGWQPIETAPTDEDEPFLVLTPGNDVAHCVVLQVSRFEGRLYPDGLNGLIDWGDGIENATHWMPLPAEPHDLSKDRGEAPNNTPKVRG